MLLSTNGISSGQQTRTVTANQLRLDLRRLGHPPVDVIPPGESAITSFGGDPSIVGNTLRTNGYPVTVIGVGPEGFQGTLGFATTDYWLSWGTADAIEPFIRLGQRDSRNFRMFARLKPGVTLDRAQAGLDTLAANLAEEYPETNEEERFEAKAGPAYGGGFSKKESELTFPGQNPFLYT